MSAFLVSTGLVALAEIGDKTMFLALCAAAAWRKPAPILAGILAATLLNHGLAAVGGALLAQWFEGPWMRWIVGGAFLGFALWALIPDGDHNCPPEDPARPAWRVFLATLALFFMVEMGDKTQIATAALAARFETVLPVLAGSTLGMMLINVPAVFAGRAAAARLPLKWIRLAAAAGFAVTGLWVLVAG